MFKSYDLTMCLLPVIFFLMNIGLGLCALSVALLKAAKDESDGRHH